MAPGITLLFIALGIILIGSIITVIQRIVFVRRQASRPPTPPSPHRHQRRTSNVTKNGTNGSNGSGTNGVTPANTWAGAGRRGDGKIRVAIVGVGNCASSLVQGRYYYENANDDDFVPGLMHVNLGGYHVRDIDFVAAFDVDKNKVGKDLADAIYTKPNNTYQFHKVEKTGVTVERGMVHDGLGKYLVRDHREGARRDGRHRRHPPGARSRRHGLVPAGRQRGGHQVVRRAGPPGRRRLRQRHPGVHRSRAVLAAPLRRGRPAGHR